MGQLGEVCLGGLSCQASGTHGSGSILLARRRQEDDKESDAVQPLPVPPWAAGNTPEPVALDGGSQVDVTSYVRFETNFADIDYGVLDIQVYFTHEGSPVNAYLLHYFAFTQDYDKCGRAVEGRAENFA